MKMEPGELNHLVCRVSREHYRRSFTELAKYGVTQGQPRILRYLRENDGCIQRDLSEHCHLEPATVTNVLSGMEKAGFVIRRSSPEDRRIQRVFLTPEGESALRQVDKAHLEIERECFEGFTPEEKEQAAVYLGRMADNIRKAEDSSRA